MMMPTYSAFSRIPGQNIRRAGVWLMHHLQAIVMCGPQKKARAEVASGWPAARPRLTASFSDATHSRPCDANSSA